LSQRIQDLIRDFQHQYPMTNGEIRQALLHAAGRAGGGSRPVALLVAGVMVAVLGVGLFVARSAGSGGDAPIPIVAVVGLFAALIAAVVAIRRAR